MNRVGFSIFCWARLAFGILHGVREHRLHNFGCLIETTVE